MSLHYDHFEYELADHVPTAQALLTIGIMPAIRKFASFIGAFITMNFGPLAGACAVKC
jgi:hypothetical protein